MLHYYKDNIQFYLLLILWLFSGMYGGPIVFLVLPASLFLLKRQNGYEEMLIGFFFILILSDSYESHLHFAKSLKNVYIVCLALFFFLDTKSFAPLNSIYKVFFPFFIISAFCLIFTATFGISIQKTLSYFLMFLIIPNYLVRLYRERGPELLKNIVFFIVTILIISILLIKIGPTVAYVGERFRGILGNPNGLGLFCFLGFILFAVVDYLHPDLFTPFEVVFIYIVFIASLLLTGSRNSIIAFFMFLFFQKFYKIHPVIGFIVVVLFAIAAELISSNLANILSSLGLGEYFRTKSFDDGSGRYLAWLFAWHHVQENFFIGRGFGYDEYYMRSNWDLLSKMGHQGGVHNTFLTFWMDMGLVGLLIFLRSYFIAFFKAAKRNRLAFPILFVVTFTAFFESWLVGSLNPHTIIFLMILTLISDDTFYPEETETDLLTEKLLTEKNAIAA